jgi:type II secretory pathway pseudopilin PulG
MRRHRRGFSLIEAIVACTFAALAGCTLMMGTYSSMQTTNDSQNRTVALGMAQQLMDEIVGNSYLSDSGTPYPTKIGPSGSVIGTSRKLFTNIGDYNGYTSQPPTDFWGNVLGTDDGQGGVRDPNFQPPSGLFTNWQQKVNVYYVSASNWITALTSGTSDYMAVEVSIVYINPVTKSTQQLAFLRRVVTYVPALP